MVDEIELTTRFSIEEEDDPKVYRIIEKTEGKISKSFPLPGDFVFVPLKRT